MLPSPSLLWCREVKPQGHSVCGRSIKKINQMCLGLCRHITQVIQAKSPSFGMSKPHPSDQSNCFLCQNFLDNLLRFVWLREPASHLGACLPNMIGSLEMKGIM